MTIELSTVIAISSVLGAFATIYYTFGKIHTWVDHQNGQDARCEAIRTEQNEKIEEIQEEVKEEIKKIQEEQCILVYSILACLKGLQQQGCNGEVTNAINEIEKHINKKAHM